VGAGEEREALAEIAGRLCAEFGYSLDHEDTILTPPPGPQHQLLDDLLGPEDQQLIATARRSLTQIAAALGADKPEHEQGRRTVRMLIDGAELVMRGELAAGNQVIGVIPSFVYLVALPMVEQDEALELSDRAATLLEEARG
jgi:hypothetical protein